MSNKMNPYLLAFGALAAWYLPTAFALLRMDFKIQDFGIVSIEAGYIDIALDFLVVNNTVIPFTVSTIELDIYLNNTFISKMYAENIRVPSSGTTPTRAIVRLNKSDIGAALWNFILQNDFDRAVFRIHGLARSLGRVYPVDSEIVISEPKK